MRNWWRKLVTWQYAGLLILVVLTLVLHFSIIAQVNTPIFDEQHYVVDGRSILAGEGDQRPEHPPLSKLFIVASMSIFGDDPVGWRFFSIIAGTLLIIVFYFICRRLEMSHESSLLATFLLSLENLTFIQASVAMLDVFYVLLMLTAFLLYLSRRYIISGLYVGLSALGKLVAVLALPVIFVHWVATQRDRRVDRLIVLGLASAVAYVVFLPLFTYAMTRQWQSPLDETNNMLSLSSSLTFATTNQDILSRPWQWVLQPTFMWYWYDPHYLGAVSFNLWALIIPAVGYMVWRAIKGNDAAAFGLAWFFGTYLLWIPLSIFTDRISFVFYFYPAIGSVCIGVGLAMSRLLDVWRGSSRWKRRWALTGVAGYMSLHVLVFIILAPVFARWTSFIRP